VSIRSDLPSLEGVAYLNAGTNGPLPRPAAEAMRRELDMSLAEPRIGMAAFQHYRDLRDRARAALGRAVGAPPEQIALTSSTTQGVGIVISGIDWKAGDEVLTTTEEHPGIRSPLDVIARRAGVRVVELPPERLLDGIGDGTRMVAVSHVLWTTGRVLDVAAISAAAHEAGASLLLDGAQSAGAIAVDAAATGADFYAFSGQKWLLGPQGSGGLWVSPQWQDRAWTAQSSYWNLEQGVVGDFLPTAARFDGGTLDTVTVAGIGAAVEWVESLPGGRAGWLAQTADNARRARERLRRQPGVTVADHGNDGAPLIALTVAGQEDTVALNERLGAQGILARYIPDTPWLRISVGAWTSDDDVERLAAALG
jgi:L-cysteine/cystine lyase